MGRSGHDHSDVKRLVKRLVEQLATEIGNGFSTILRWIELAITRPRNSALHSKISLQFL